VASLGGLGADAERRASVDAGGFVMVDIGELTPDDVGGPFDARGG
jgi:hypothetical protein